MANTVKTHQAGFSMIGILFVGIVLAITGVILAQAVPTYTEYRSILTSVNKAKNGADVAEMRSLFDKAAQVDTIKSITGKDLDITRVGDRVVIRFAYEREIHLAGPAYLTLKYAGESN